MAHQLTQEDIHAKFGGALRATPPRVEIDSGFEVHRELALSHQIARRTVRQIERAATFCAVWNQYRKVHSWRYAARIARGIAYQDLPF